MNFLVDLIKPDALENNAIGMRELRLGISPLARRKMLIRRYELYNNVTS
jgi:hypothetical protein